MDTLFETDLLRNTTLGASAIWQFSAAYYKQQNRRSPVPFLSTFLVLPMVFHEATVKAISNRNKDGALLKALSDDRTILLGLQRRVKSFADRTFKALNLAAASQLIRIDREHFFEITPSVKSLPVSYSSDDAKSILRAADRVGHSAALYGFETTCSLLGVRF